MQIRERQEQEALFIIISYYIMPTTLCGTIIVHDEIIFYLHRTVLQCSKLFAPIQKKTNDDIEFLKNTKNIQYTRRSYMTPMYVLVTLDRLSFNFVFTEMFWTIIINEMWKIMI